MWAKSITGRTQLEARGDLDDVVDRAELADAAHHLDAERDGAVLPLELLAQGRERGDDVVDRLLGRAPEPEAGMDDDHLRAAAAAIPAVRSSAPSAIFDFFSSGWPGNANSGACTESAMSSARASSPSRSAQG